ncbi:MAG: O-antigen ligase family protein, partial [Anaerolineales bacterium]|nr:O-antigen ligase family protein [Anaerolineales bacterium]
VSIFFVALLPGLPPRLMTRRLFGVVIGFSLVTTAVSLLQLAYWEGLLPFGLPAWLVTFQEGANQARGRELFALFIGDTGTHVWSAMLVLQAIAVWVLASSSRRLGWRLLGMGYFGVLALLVVRTSVRNSILGLVVVIGVLVLLQARRSRYAANRVARPLLLLLVGVLLLLGVFAFAADSYFVERIWQTIPRLEDGQLVVERGSNVYGRVDYAVTALRMFARSPIWGGGFYTYEIWTYRLRAAPIAHAHNSYLQALAEMGLIGFGALAWLLWRVWLLLRRAGRRVGAGDVWYGRLWRLTAATALFLGFTALFANPFWQPKEVAFCALLLALLVRYEQAEAAA